MKLALDTNTVIYILNDRPEQVGRHFIAAGEAQAQIFVSAIVLHELWYGALRSERPEKNSARIIEFLASPIDIIDFTVEDAKIAGDLRCRLARSGQPIGPYDVLIAAQALRIGAILVTSNTGEFSRIQGLGLVDWTVPA